MNKESINQCLERFKGKNTVIIIGAVLGGILIGSVISIYRYSKIVTVKEKTILELSDKIKNISKTNTNLQNELNSTKNKLNEAEPWFKMQEEEKAKKEQEEEAKKEQEEKAKKDQEEKAKKAQEEQPNTIKRENLIGKSNKTFANIEKSKPTTVINDKTGNLRLMRVATNENFLEYASNYSKKNFTNNKEIHAIVNFTLNTTTRVSKLYDNALSVSVHEYIKKEEHDANKLFGGMVLGEYIVYLDNGDIEEIK